MPSSDQSTAPLPIIPFNLLICAYLFISHDWVVLFLDAIKLTDEVEDHLRALNIERKEYNDIWAFLRRRIFFYFFPYYYAYLLHLFSHPALSRVDTNHDSTTLLHPPNLSLGKSFCSFIFLISTNSLLYSLAALGRQRQLCHQI